VVGPTKEAPSAATALEATDVFGVAALGASFVGPTTLTIHNPTGVPLQFGTILRVASARGLTLSTPTLVSPGTPVLLTATVTGALPGEVPTFVVTNDNGDVAATGAFATDAVGQWTATITAPPAGTYGVSAALADAEPRIALAAFVVSDGGSFVGGFTESALDPDGDGLTDTLVVEVPVNVATAGEYRLAAQILDGSGRVVSAAGTTLALEAGQGTIPLQFGGREIYDRALAGPWSLDATLSGADMSLLAIADLGPARNDNPQDFEHDALEVEGFSDEAVDLEGDGLIDILRIRATARSSVSGWYSLNGKLVSTDGTEVGRASRSLWLDAGANELTLDFAGAAIGEAHRDGPYTL
ncbi:MAG TPA: Ig-like domain-containing protein, partial [Coriobacteriia bacterium]|nr:Ig-like domain-containing protein [Coriobacteriia bacterium]